MKIAIVAPSPVPFTIGGAENLIKGLNETMNSTTKHQVEIIKLPSNENDFWSLIENYYNFYKLDLKHFDLVITTKYPSWMIQHRNSICYMIHPLRGLYDTYHLMNMPFDVPRGNKEIDEVLDYMDNNKNINTLDTFYEMLFKMKNKSNNIPKAFFDFPAPFIRKLIHYMDTFALSKKRVKNYFAISETVKNRKDYFPMDTEVEVVYPPSNLKDFSEGEYQYIYMISRLDAPKRIDMLIRAMKYVRSDIKLLIAGTGPQSEELMKLAKNDTRIQFLGFISDDEAEKYYSNSLVIPYFPYEEDYGLITIEAMMHKKPVITTLDSGGPTEFVINGVTGFVTKFNEVEIARKIDYFAQNPSEAKKMGENGYYKVKDITWNGVVKALLKDSDIIVKKDKEIKKDKITVAVTFPTFPPLNGGQVRIYNLYKALSKKYSVEIIVLSPDKKSMEELIDSDMKEICIAKTDKHKENEWSMEKKIGLPVSDVGAISLTSYTPEYEKRLKKSIDESKMVFVSHPYLYRIISKYIGNKQLIYEAQDVEYEIKKEMFPKNDYSQKLLKEIFDVERECCANSNVIMTCSEKDKMALRKLYKVDNQKIIVVPNGVDCSETVFTGVQERLQYKVDMGLEKETIGLFIGSWHKPNLEACEKIFMIAQKCPSVKFLLMGSQCEFFKGKSLPNNVGLLGIVDVAVKRRIFSVVDFALNPMLSGSGTNLKMFDYMSAGLPVITTEFGTRGIDEKNLFIISEVEDMVKYIQNYSLEEQEQRVKEAASYTNKFFDWNVIGKNALDEIEKIIKK